jgi:hypothetical protein
MAPPERRGTSAVSDLAPKSKQAFHELLDVLREVSESYFVAERGIIEEGTAAEGYRLLLHMLAAGTEHHLEGDPARPMFTRIVSPQRKTLGDNPDAVYFWTRIDGRRAYRIRGNVDGADYTSFTVHGVDPAGGSMERVVADLCDRDFRIEADGSYEITVAREPHPGNWIRTEPDATSIVTRHYYERATPIAAEPDLRIRLRIDPLEPAGAPPPWNDESMACGLHAVARFVRANTLGMPPPGQAPHYAFVSRTPNVLPRPSSFRAAQVATVGAVDIHYAMAPFLLQPEQALVMEGRLPPCRFANVVLWNMNMQTLEYRVRRTSLNRKQIGFAPDGSFRIVVAHRDPGAPNWLDTEGHTLGTIFWRIVLPDAEPDEIRCTLTDLAALR